MPDRGTEHNASGGAKRRAALAAIAVALATAAAILAGLGPDFVTGQAAGLRLPSGDLAQHLTGALYFQAEPWGLPPFAVTGLDAPEGANIAFTDSIPLIALLAKLMAGLTGGSWNYLPGFIALAFVLQGPAFIVLLRSLGVTRFADLALGGLIAVLAPPLLSRVGHAALCGHFVVILALACHFHAVGGTGRPKAVGFYAPLAVLGLLIHPYLMVMTLAVCTATVLQLVWNRRLSLPAALGWLAATVGTVLLAMLAGGYLGEGLSPRPYGDYALNLVSPFVSPKSGLLPVAVDVKPTGYIGLGGLALVAIMVVRFRGGIGRALSTHFALVVVCLALTAYALTYGVFAGGVLVAGLDPAVLRQAVLGGRGLASVVSALSALDWLRLAILAAVLAAIAGLCLRHVIVQRRFAFLALVATPVLLLLVGAVVAPGRILAAVTQFQASERMVWPAVYLVLALGVASATRWARPMVGTAVLAAALPVQWLDTAPMRAEIAESFLAPPLTAFTDEAAVTLAVGDADVVQLVPDFECAMILLGNDAPAGLKATYDRLHLIAALAATSINSARTARMTTVGTDARRAGCMASGAAGPARTVRVEVDLQRHGGPAIVHDAQGCRQISIGALCVADGAPSGQAAATARLAR